MNFRAKNIQHYDLVISLFGAKIQIHITKVKKINEENANRLLSVGMDISQNRKL